MIVRPVVCRPFIGRRDEIAYLRERRLEAGSSRGGLVMIAGDAGLGKTRLIAEFSTSLASLRWRVAYGPCTESGRRPYGPVLDALARLDPRSTGLAPAESRQEQLDAIVDRFAAITARNATVLVVEDLHFADAATLDLLAFLSPRLSRMRALVLVSFRPGELHPNHPATAGIARIAQQAQAARIDLSPLAGNELRSFIDEALSGVELSDEMRRSVARSGEGNPFFTEELLKNAVVSASQDAGRAARTLPQTLRAVLIERLQPLDDRARHIVTQAAVIGRTFGLDLLATVTNATPQQVLPALRIARDLQLVEEVTPASFRFRHALTREAIYAEFLGAEVQPLHRGIAMVLESAPEPQRALEDLAYHWWAAGDGEHSARYNDLAGDAADRVHAHEDAIAFYERALEAATLDPAARAAILEKVAERRIALTWTDEAWATYNTAAALFAEAGAFDREASCRSQAAILAYVTGRPTPTAALEAMLETLPGEQYLARTRVHLGLAWLLATFGFANRAEHHLAHVDARALDDAADIGLRFHNVSAWVAMLLGDLERFRVEHARWVEGARAGGSVRGIVSAHVNGAMCYTFFGCHDDANDNLERAFGVARGARNRYTVESCDAFAAMCLLMQGDLAGARKAAEAVPASTEHHVNLTFAISWGSVVALHLGDKPMLDKWFAAFETSGAAKPEIEHGAGMAEALVRRGQSDAAAELLHRVVPECEIIRGNVLTFLAIARYGSGADRRRARAYLQRAAAGPSECLERPALALFDAICARRDGTSANAERAREAAAGFRRLRTPLLEAAALEEAGERDAALAAYRRCGALADVQRLQDPGEKPGAEGAAPQGEALSSREREIGELAAHGHSNVEIARTLSISHKTVEKHLASTYRKLGVSSRRELRTVLPPRTPS